MASRTVNLSEHEISAMQRAEAVTGETRTLKRLPTVRLYGSGPPVPTIQAWVGCRWRAYRIKGRSGLQSHWQGNKRRKLSREQRADLKARVRSDRPDPVVSAEGRLSQGQFGTVSDLKIGGQRWYGGTYRRATSYQTLLHECGLSQQPTEGHYRSQPDALTSADVEARPEKKGRTWCT
ncbi:MAG TPA: hypothetical protein VMT34_04780, partial [Aggregatilineales bacterium]|nr:hypothetical protein [Aggregatilineales bacterium]